VKPLGQKAYGHIGHLPNSKLGKGDHHVHEGQAKICTEKARDKYDRVFVQEKLDGSCVAAALLEGVDGREPQLVALVRAGYLAQSSKYEQHQLWAAWVREHEDRFRNVLRPGERLCGEWLAQAHGTRYEALEEPFVAFDIIRGHTRLPFGEFTERDVHMTFEVPFLAHDGGPVSVEKVYAEIVKENRHRALNPHEGVIYRVERNDVVDFLAKWVRPDKQDGCYLPSETGEDPVWNWRPGKGANV
jgi:hypothetical protein